MRHGGRIARVNADRQRVEAGDSLPLDERILRAINKGHPPKATGGARAALRALPQMPGRVDLDVWFPDHCFTEPSFTAIAASWRARGWPIVLDGRPRAWGLLAVASEPAYAAWAERWKAWEAALRERDEDPGGSIGRAHYDATKPTAERTWFIGHEIW